MKHTINLLKLLKIIIKKLLIDSKEMEVFRERA